MMLEPSIEELILAGAIEVAGVDPESGEFLYNFTVKSAEIMPEIFHQHMEMLHDEITFFIEEGFLEVEDNDRETGATLFLTPLSFDASAINDLPLERQESLKEIKRMFEK